LARILGVLLFLPVPLVLWLFTRLPLGRWESLSLGVLLMASHRLYARPFARARAQERCLFCGGGARDGPEVLVGEPTGTTAWRCCHEAHARRLQSILGWASAHRRALLLGIGGATGLLLFGTALAGRGPLRGVTSSDVAALFRVLVALCVLPLGFLGPLFVPPDGVPSVPFPVHIQALTGTLVVVWLFRIVGAVWLFLGLAHLLGRLS
jgi:hypothetical protein